jgi:polysaccharide export outer membrane protein
MAAKHIVRFGLVAAFVFGCTALGLAQQNPKVSPRDQLNIEVFGIDSMKGKFRVDADGTISFPPLEQPVKVAGLTIREVETLLSNRLFEESWLTVHAKVNVELEQTPNKRVLVAGEVRQPGEVKFAGELTVLDALIQSGSTTQDASDRVMVIRASLRAPDGSLAANKTGDTGVIEVNLQELQNGQTPEKNLMLQDGDRVFVPKAAQVYIDGYVNRPGAYSVTAGMTLKQVITLAGGIAERGAKGRIDILRGGKKVEKVNYEKTTVMPGDTITVKSRIF